MGVFIELSNWAHHFNWIFFAGKLAWVQIGCKIVFIRVTVKPHGMTSWVWDLPNKKAPKTTAKLEASIVICRMWLVKRSKAHAGDDFLITSHRWAVPLSLPHLSKNVKGRKVCSDRFVTVLNQNRAALLGGSTVSASTKHPARLLCNYRRRSLRGRLNYWGIRESWNSFHWQANNSLLWIFYPRFKIKILVVSLHGEPPVVSPRVTYLQGDEQPWFNPPQQRLLMLVQQGMV